MTTTATFDFTRYENGDTVLKIRRTWSASGALRRDHTYFNPTQRQLDRLSVLNYVTLSNSNGEAGWWKAVRFCN